MSVADECPTAEELRRQADGSMSPTEESDLLNRQMSLLLAATAHIRRTFGFVESEVEFCEPGMVVTFRAEADR